jgi:pimeloyl-ACP methyl ester carboxylesterase
MAFSVATTWALQVAGGDLRDRFRAVVGLAGYGDFRRMVRAMVVGEHEWQGSAYRYRPDPYGRWIIGAGLLPLIDAGAYGERAEREAAGRALHTLATTAGRNGAPADEPVYDALIERLRSRLPDSVRPAWDLLAPTSEAAPPDVRAGRTLADALSAAGVRAFPNLDPTGALAGISADVRLLHGRFDRLVPFTETLRLAAQLPPGVRRSVAITRLAGHTKTAEAARLRNPLALARESWRFARFMQLSLERVAG